VAVSQLRDERVLALPQDGHDVLDVLGHHHHRGLDALDERGEVRLAVGRTSPIIARQVAARRGRRS
jgi:hypothetical protein